MMMMTIRVNRSLCRAKNKNWESRRHEYMALLREDTADDPHECPICMEMTGGPVLCL